VSGLVLLLGSLIGAGFTLNAFLPLRGGPRWILSFVASC